MIAKFIYEKFTEESDPIKDIGIGLTKLKKEIVGLQLFNILSGMSEYWRKMFLKDFGENENNIYYLGDTKNNYNIHIEQIKAYIKLGNLIKKDKFSTGGSRGEIVTIKIYETAAGKIAIFRYKYDNKIGDSSDNIIQYIGTIQAAFRFNIKENLSNII